MPSYSKYDLLFVAEGESFDLMNEDTKNKFKKGLLALQNIDDRFIIEWNNIRIINQNEKKIKDYLIVKNSKNSNFKNLLSLNLNDNGVSVISEDNKNYNNAPNQNSLDSLFNNNDDVTKTSLEISKGNSIENIYSKNINLRSYANSLSHKDDHINNKVFTHSIEYYPEYYDNYFNVRKYDSTNPDPRLANNVPFISFNEKLSKILKDPTILKLEDYIKNFSLKTSNINKILKSNDQNGKNTIENLEKKILTIKDNFLKSKIKISDINNLNIIRFKERENSSLIKVKNPLFTNLTIYENISNMEENNEFKEKISFQIKYCFNKNYYSKEFNISGQGNFFKCYELIEFLNKNNVEALNKIDKINKVLRNLKSSDEDIELENYLKDTNNLKKLEKELNETNLKEKHQNYNLSLNNKAINDKMIKFESNYTEHHLAFTHKVK